MNYENITQHIARSLHDIGISVDTNPYKFLDKIDRDRFMIIGLGGSYAYGTNVPTSDLDIRGFALNSVENILTGKDFEQITNNVTDTTIYSLNKMIQLLSNCNPNTIEIVGLKPEHYLYVSDFGKSMLERKDMFLSKKAIKSFGGYATSQLYRLQQKTNYALTEEELNAHVAKVLNGVKETIYKGYDVSGFEIYFKDGEIKIDISVSDYKLDDFVTIIETFNKTLRDYRQRSVRNDKAIAHDKISKHAMHLLRLYMMLYDILKYGEINTYREKEHDLLMAIRNNEFLDDRGMLNAEFFNLVNEYKEKCEVAEKTTDLPDEPDYAKIKDFLICANYGYMKRCEVKRITENMTN